MVWCPDWRMVVPLARERKHLDPAEGLELTLAARLGILVCRCRAASSLLFLRRLCCRLRELQGHCPRNVQITVWVGIEPMPTDRRLAWLEPFCFHSICSTRQQLVRKASTFKAAEATRVADCSDDRFIAYYFGKCRQGVGKIG